MKFTERSIRDLRVESGRQIFFDDTVKGLVVKVSDSGHKAFYIFYRLGRGRKYPKQHLKLGDVGQPPTLTVKDAQDRARELLGQVVQGLDPAKMIKEANTEQTVKECLDLFLEEYVLHRLKPKTISLYGGIIKNHLVPAIGRLKVTSVTHRDIAAIHNKLKEKKFMANRVLSLASKFFNWCESNGFRPRGNNPADGIEKYYEEVKSEFLDITEIEALNDGIRKMEAQGSFDPLAGNALRLLMLTGARLNEILSLKWANIDWAENMFKISVKKVRGKSEERTLPLTDQIRTILLSMRGNEPTNDYVFPSEKSKSGHIEGLRRPWDFVCAQSDLEGRWRKHDLRHAYASLGINTGIPIEFVQQLLGHSDIRTTGRYAHKAPRVTREMAKIVGKKLAEYLDLPSPETE